MPFCLQLRIILWKNFIFRKRQKIRLFVELLWPLILFLILMWVRTRGLRKGIDECHFTEKALPSTGFMPFIQSFICTFNNTCHRTKEEAIVRTGDLTTKGTIEFYLKLRKILSDNSTNPLFRTFTEVISNRRNAEPEQNSIRIAQFLQQPDDLYRKFIENNLNISKTSYNKLINYNVTNDNYEKSPLSLLDENSHFQLCNEFHGTDDIFDELCDLSDSDMNILKNELYQALNDSININQLNYYFKENLDKYISWKDWNELSTSFSSTQETINFSRELTNYQNSLNPSSNDNSSKFEQAVDLVFSFFCGNTSEEIGSIFTDPMGSSGQPTRFDSLQDQFRNRSIVRYHYDDDLTPECNAILSTIESNPKTMLLWRSVKPFFMGRILYTPITPVTESLMKRVNASFEPMIILIDLLSSSAMRVWTNESLSSNLRLAENLRSNILTIQEFSRSSSLGQEEFINDTDISLERFSEILKNLINNLDPNKTLDKIPLSAMPENFDRSDGSLKGNARSSLLKCYETNKIRGYKNTYEAEEEGMRLITFNKLWAVIEFQSPGEDKLSPLTTYKIRMNTERVDNTLFLRDLISTPSPRRRPGIDLKYITYGFAYLQDLLDHSIIVEHTGRKDLPGFIFQQFPYPCYISDEFIMAISRTFPLFMVLSWSYSCAMIVKSIVYEKEQRLKETMRVMGLGNGIHWIGWFIDSLIPMCVTLIVLVLILVYGKVLINSNPIVIYIFLFCYVLSTIAQAFLISVFFSKANLAAACTGIIFFILYLPYPFLVRWMSYLTPLHKTLLSLSANVALGLGASYIAYYEELGVGIQWNNINKSPLYGDEFNLVSVIGMLLFDFIIYLIITWYIEAVFPGQYGIPRPWYFPFTLSYWTGRQVTKVFVKDNKAETSDGNFEGDPPDLIAGVEVKNLTKIFNKGKVAVNDISLNFYEGQITSFLGHNGAGKTTTISMLTGLFPPTSGTAVINGFDIKSDISKVRKNLGMCPQHNVLFNRLTVEEHLWFYGMLRRGSGKNMDVLNSEIDEMIVDLGLPHKRDSLSTSLSGGMQRKLSVAVAFIGGSRTVILDEPTSGVDPYSRRSIWELLIKYKKGKTVILTTHYMDEADLLGDRIAIIANGKVMCCGTGLFLKRKFGSGYHLTLEMNSFLSAKPSGLVDVHDEEDAVFKDLTAFIQLSVPTAQFIEHIGNDILYVLPEKDISRLSDLCDSLDKNLSKLNLVSYGISDSSLEEIFIRVAETGDISLREPETKRKNSQIPFGDENDNKKPGSRKYWRQFIALHTKRFYHTIRNAKGLFAELILPAFFICLSLAVTTIIPKFTERPPLELSLWKYNSPRFMFYYNNASAVSSFSTSDDIWASRYLDEILGPDGIGTQCMNIYGKRNPQCSDHSSINSRGVNFSIIDCSCASGGQICPDNIDVIPPPSFKIVSKDTLFNMTKQNLSEWIVNTWPKYSYQRLGGYTLAANVSVPDLSLIEIARFIKTQITNNMNLLFSLLGGSLPNIYTPATKNNIKVWYNNKGWISSVAYLNAMSNVVLRASLHSLNMPSDEISKYGITTINHPMNFTQKQMNIELIGQGVVSILHSISIIFALSFVPASFTLYLIEERVSFSKHLLLVSGVNRLILWLEQFIWDIVAYTLSAFLCILIFVIFNEQSYVSPTNLPGVISLFLLYGWACIPLMYLLSYCFTVPSTAFVGLACGNMFIGIVTTVTTFVLGAFEDEELRAVHDVVKEVFLIFPHFCLGSGIMDLAQNHIASTSLSNLGMEYTSNIFEWNLLGKPLTCMFVLGSIFFIVVLLVELGLFGFFYKCIKISNVIEDDLEEEEDVASERARIHKEDTKDDILVVKDLTKIYKGSKVPSVRKINVGVQQGECFGLLGINGAGKTTTFKMLTGATSVTSGIATVRGYSIAKDMPKVQAFLGYCPQFDALDPLLTPREHLILYGRIRNIPSSVLEKRVDFTLQQMGLGYYSNKLAGTLSGGNKRKLSASIALIGNPPLVYMDEPTTGMDPKARRFLWTKIQDIVKSGTSVVLTSHSMEECQALCTRLTIMVNGRFRCIGTSQHLKNKYGGGYRIVIRCNDKNNDTVKEFMKTIKSSSITEEHSNQLRYEIPHGKLSDIFNQLEKAKDKNLLEDYSLSQTTLEEVFLRFANEQHPDEIPKEKKPMPALIKKCLSCCRGKKEE